jgi:enterochelin esterase family protein
LLVVLDGPDYLRRVRLPVIVDNLIAQGRIRPLALAMVDSSAAARFIEYACSEATVGFLTQIVVPYARQHLNLLDVQVAAAHGVMGASMGGVMALYAAARAPEVFGRVLSQSGAFSMPNHDFVIFELLKQASAKPLHIWMDVGVFEWLLDCNRRMHALLVTKGYDAAYREYSGGHNYPAWRDDLWHGLEHLYSAAYEVDR